MTWSINVTKQAEKDLKGIDSESDMASIRVAIAELLPLNMRALDVSKLVNEPGYRLRVGRWRVRFDYEKTTQTVLILRVLPRKEAYR